VLVLDEGWVLDDLAQEADHSFGHVIRHSGSVMDLWAILERAVSFDCPIDTNVYAWKDILNSSDIGKSNEFL